ncbi:MAG: NAD(P)H-dependent oxidoreductase, partial [Oscillospiraceae bacterium]
MSKILAICGSPRKEGNIETMLETAVALARAQGHIVTCYNPYEMEIAYCKGCMACKKSSKC